MKDGVYCCGTQKLNPTEGLAVNGVQTRQVRDALCDARGTGFRRAIGQVSAEHRTSLILQRIILGSFADTSTGELVGSIDPQAFADGIYEKAAGQPIRRLKQNPSRVVSWRSMANGPALGCRNQRALPALPPSVTLLE